MIAVENAMVLDYNNQKSQQMQEANMLDYSIQNKKAWEYNAYVKEAGTPADRAKKSLLIPMVH